MRATVFLLLTPCKLRNRLLQIKDASRGYLKLLLLTAATGDSRNGQGIQRNRDLSMILDALLKTKSRTVLVDVINKNGMALIFTYHNIIEKGGMLSENDGLSASSCNLSTSELVEVSSPKEQRDSVRSSESPKQVGHKDDKANH